MADALSCVAPHAFPNEQLPSTPVVSAINAILSITTDHSILDAIKASYKEDTFCLHVASTHMKGWKEANGLWYIGDRLLIPHVAGLCKSLFQLAHDSLSHFRADKSYTSL